MYPLFCAYCMLCSMDPAQSLRNGGSTRNAAIRLLEAASVRFNSPLHLTGDAAALQSSQPLPVMSPDPPSSSEDTATSPPILPHADSTGHLA